MSTLLQGLLLTASASLLLLSGQAAWSADNAHFSIDDYFRLKRVVELAMSSDSAYVAYVVEGASLEDDPAAKRRVYVHSTRSGAEAVPLPEVDPKALGWIPRSEELTFLSSRSGTSQVYSFDIRTGTTRQHTHSAEPVNRYAFSPDGTRLAYITRADRKDISSLYHQFQTGDSGIRVDPNTVSAVDFIDPDSSTLSREQSLQSTLWLSEDTHAGKATAVEAGGDVLQFLWSSDSQLLSVNYVGNEIPKLMTRNQLGSIGVIDVRDGRMTPLIRGQVSTDSHPAIGYAGGEWIPGERSMVVRRITLSSVWASKHFPDYAIIGAGVAATHALDWRRMQSYDARLIPVSARTVLVENTLRAVRGLFELRKGVARPSAVGRGLSGSNSLFAFSSDRSRVAFVNQSLTNPTEIYVQRGWKSLPTQLTNLNVAIRDKIMPKTREVRWQGIDGVGVSGWLLEPHDRPRSGTLPLVTFVHGGPGYAFADEFVPYFRLWPYPLEVLPAYGIAVFVPNYRGTHSYDVDFSSPAGIDGAPADDIISGIKWLIAQGFADPKRLGIAGHSHGAWLGPLVMTRYKRFRASSFAEGTPNMVVAYESVSGQLNRQVYDTQIGANLYDAPSRYIEISPSLHMAGITSANLVEGGAQSEAVFMLSLAKASLRQQLPTEMIVYPRSGHNLKNPRLQRESAQRNLEWFRSWLVEKVQSEEGLTEADP